MKELLWQAKFGIDLVSARIFKRYIPFQVQLSITDKCNLRCSYCYARYHDRGYADLPLESLGKIIDELARLGTKRVNLVGGEPLLRGDVTDIIDRIRSHGMKTAMTSNGYLVPAKIDTVKKLDLICISLDGGKEAHDKCRGPGSFEAAMKAVETARAEGIPLQVAAVITKYNINSIDQLMAMGRKYGFAIGFATLINQTQGGVKVPPEMIPSDSEYRDVLGHIIDLKKRGYPVLFSAASLSYARDWPYSYSVDKVMDPAGRPFRIACNAGKYFAIIDTNGDIYPCPSLVGVIKPLNAVTDGVERAFKHINSHGCRACHIPCQNEFNLLYSLNPRVILNTLTHYRP